MNDSDLLSRVQALQPTQLDWTRQLIAIPTVNPYSGDNSAGSEAPGQAWMQDILKAMGATVSTIPVPADVYQQANILGPQGRQWIGRDNILGTWTLGNGDGPTILVNDHMDTVGTEGMTINPYDPVIKDGKLFGRGTTDTKGNLVVGLIAIKALLENTQGLHGKIIFQSVVDEECNGAGAGTLACCLAGITGDVAIVLDGSAGTIVHGCNGVATASVTLHGKAGHNAQGSSVNAIDKAILAKAAIDRFAADHLAAYPTCRTNVGVFRAGSLPSVVPGQAELQINFSYAPEDAQTARDTAGQWDGRVFRQRFEDTLHAELSKDAWVKDHPATIRWIKDLYPFHSDPQSPAVQLAAQAAHEVAGKAVPVAPMHAWFDGAHLATQLDIPVVGLGSGHAGCSHSADEHALLDDLYRGAKTVALTLSRLLQKA